MAHCDEQKFEGITEQKFNCIVKRAEESTGILLDGHAGQAGANGIQITWEFDVTAQTLSIRCVERPFFLPCGVVEAQVEGLIKNCC